MQISHLNYVRSRFILTPTVDGMDRMDRKHNAIYISLQILRKQQSKYW